MACSRHDLSCREWIRWHFSEFLIAKFSADFTEYSRLWRIYGTKHAIQRTSDVRRLGMTMTKTRLRELDEAISRGTPESRARALWHATDLLIAGSYSEEEIETFGRVIERLAEEIEVEVRAVLSVRLSQFDEAPVNVIRKLAFDVAIEVAGPMLEKSERLDDDTLIANVRSKSQSHMLAISRRTSLDEKVTDALVA